MSLKTFGFSAVARALAATAVLGFGIAGGTAASAQVEQPLTSAQLGAAIEAALENTENLSAAQIRTKIGNLIKRAASDVNVEAVFMQAKAVKAAKWQDRSLPTYNDNTRIAITEIQSGFEAARYTRANGGTSSTGTSAFTNTGIGAFVAAGGHS